ASDPNFKHIAMYPIYSPAEAHLSGDDTRGACFLYPSSADQASGLGMAVDATMAAVGCDSAADPQSLSMTENDGGAICGPNGHCEGNACDRGSPFGARCRAASDCESHDCLAGVMHDAVCTRSCGADFACPAGWSCLKIDKRDVCVPVHAGCRIGESM